MYLTDYRNERGNGMVVFLSIVLVLILGLLIYLGISGSGRLAPAAPAAPVDPRTVLLQEGDGRSRNGMMPTQVPGWLLIHMGVIASLQILSLLWAALRASEPRLGKRDAQLILFLCEVPMYLGLFGTLLGVCLTQFISGSLVAPLAYCTTMSGVVLHVIGKLGIWLRLPDELIEQEA